MNNTYKKKFLPEEFFIGDFKANGSFFDIFGYERQTFEINAIGKKTSNGFSLEEKFLYKNGGNDFRQWDVSKKSNSSYIGVANDVYGKVKGIIKNNCFYWNYLFHLKIGNKRIWVKFKDQMILKDDITLLNFSKVTKYGFPFGNVRIEFKKLN